MKIKTKILDGTYISNMIIKDINKDFKEILKSKIYYGVPTIAIILIGNDESSKIYVKNKKEKANNIGYKIIIYKFIYNVKEIKIVNLINNLNKNKFIHGILVQLPLPKNINTLNILSKININKDIDCLNPINVGMSFYNKSIFKNCTVYAILTLLKKYYIKLNNLYSVIIGSSNLIGKPLAIELINKNSIVTLINKNNSNIYNFVKKADLLIVAVGIPNFIKCNNIKKRSILIDVGINRIKNNKIIGDIDKKKSLNKASYISPVPGGIGPMTIAIFLKNSLKAFKINSIKN